MANIYKNAFYDPSTTDAVTLYTAPTNANAIIQNIQITNQGGFKTVTARVTDSSATTSSLLHTLLLVVLPFVTLQKVQLF